MLRLLYIPQAGGFGELLVQDINIINRNLSRPKSHSAGWLTMAYYCDFGGLSAVCPEIGQDLHEKPEAL